MSGFGGGKGDFGGSANAGGAGTNNAALLGISVAVLAFGLIFAFAFKGRML